MKGVCRLFGWLNLKKVKSLALFGDSSGLSGGAWKLQRFLDRIALIFFQFVYMGVGA